MVQLARSVQHRLGATVWFAAAVACSPPEWPDASGGAGTSANGGSGSSPAPSAPSTGSNEDAPPAMGVKPAPTPVSSLGPEGSTPINGGLSQPDAGAMAGGSDAPVASQPDAGAEAMAPPPDASTEPPAPVEPEPVCDGTLLGGVCWYLGETGDACDDTCATHGGFSPVTAMVLGTPDQGGSQDGCAAVLEALTGYSVPILQGFRNDDNGVGCHVFEDDDGLSAWWLTSPEFSSDVSVDDARVVCGCSR